MPDSRIEISEVGRLGYMSDVGPISFKPLAVVTVVSWAAGAAAVGAAGAAGVLVSPEASAAPAAASASAPAARVWAKGLIERVSPGDTARRAERPPRPD